MNLSDHLEKLQYFRAIAETGSIKRAAEIVYVTQPSLTKSLKTLEEAIGRKLFIRKPRGVELTQEGEILMDFCQRLFAGLADTEQKLSFPDDPYAGALKVGTYESIGIYFWPQFLKKFLPRYPKLNLQMETGRSREIQLKLERGELDLVLVIEPVPDANTETIILKKDSFCFYQSPKTKLFDSPKTAPLIFMPSALTSSQELKKTIDNLGLQNRRVYTCSSLETVKELTMNGIGIGLLPKMVAKSLLKKNQLSQVYLPGIAKSGIGEHQLGLAYQKTRADSPLIQLLIAQIQKELA